MANIDAESLLDRSDLTDETLRLYEELLKGSGETGIPDATTPAYHVVTPLPGFCLKTKNEKKEKVFINVCQADNVPEAKDISDEDLIKLLESDDPTSYRIPMSLGEPHVEVDKSGKGCTVYDIVVNPSFMERIHRSELMKGFFLTVSLEGLEHKYNMTLDRNWVILKNRKCIGTLSEQNIRKESKPWIMEMDDNTPSSGIQTTAAGKPLISEVSSTKMESTQRPKAPEPPYTILQEPPEGHPEYYVAEIQLPKVKSAATMTLDIGEDRILLQTRSSVYHLDVYLPKDVLQEECAAQFNRKTQILTVTMPVQPVH